MTSFSNPNYGLDALNSNCLPPADHPSHDYVIVDNVTSLAGDRRYATDNGLPFEQVTSSSSSSSSLSSSSSPPPSPLTTTTRTYYYY